MQTLRRINLIILTIFSLTACSHNATQPIAKKRDAHMRQLFMNVNPCPSTGKIKGACPGYVVDHVIAIKRGGADSPYNMQWQSIEDGKQKDLWE